MNPKFILQGGTHLLTALGTNAVPAMGVFAGGWAAETAMLVYLLETLLLIGLSSLRVRLLAPAHEAPLVAVTAESSASASLLVPNKPRNRRQILEGFLVVSLGFATVSGVFIGVFLFLILKAPLVLADVATGLTAILVIQLFALVTDLILWRGLSLAQAEGLLLQTLRRALVLYLGVFVGLCGAAYAGNWFVTPFIIFKTLMDLGLQVEHFLKRRPAL